MTFYSTLTHPLIGILLLVTDGERLTRSSYLDSAERLALATGAATYRWEDLTKAPVSPSILLNPRRYADGAKDLWNTLVFESSVAKFASTVKEDCPGGCVSSLAFVEPYLNSALSPFFKNAHRRHGLVLGYGATNLQEIEEGLRRLASILQKRGPLIVHQDNTVFTLIYFQTTSARLLLTGRSERLLC